ncbi:hypothetical protein [Terrimonas ginsenosidimutans]|nr:hypothetical protein [Terrimonas ginsenosidimutans]
MVRAEPAVANSPVIQSTPPIYVTIPIRLIQDGPLLIRTAMVARL